MTDENSKDGKPAGTEMPAGGQTATAQDGVTQAQVGIMGQYIKDLSFENPNAPAVLQQIANNKPNIDVSVNVNARKLGDEAFEVELKISCNSKYGDAGAFVVELVYGTLFGVRNAPEQALEPFLLINAPSLMFPFARRIIADATRDGGFPPLMLDPIDFAGLYQQQQAQQQAAGGGDGQGAINIVN